jgi:hypothetical protein
VLERLWGGPETLIVVSSDLSHYHDYETARRLDAATATAIEHGDWGKPEFRRARCRIGRGANRNVLLGNCRHDQLLPGLATPSFVCDPGRGGRAECDGK